MPSPVRTLRLALETALRVAAVGLLLWALWLALRPRTPATRTGTVSVAELPAMLRAWVRAPAPDSVHLRADSVPDATYRDWMVALRRAGAAVGWSGDIAPVAVAVEPVNAPAGGARITVAGVPGDTVRVADAAGPIQSIVPEGHGGSVRAPAIAEPITAAVGGTRARARAMDALDPGAILVLGTAGWEARYVIAALEEEGWTVDARLTVGPGLVVRRGTPGSIDTARYAAVIALDSAAAGDGRRVATFARDGGGVVLSGVAAALPGVRDIAPGRPGPRLRPAALVFVSDSPRRALALLPVSRPRTDAVILERRDAVVAVAARRSGAGRVVQVGYDETWRWRMQGGEGGTDAHRRWWSSLVSGVARQRAVPVDPAWATGDAAPRAAVVAALGPPSAPVAGSTSGTGRSGPHPWMLGAVILLLITEWTSRRLRGVA